MYKNTLKCLCVLAVFAAGCGTNLGAEQRARNACPTLTDTEFEVLWNLAILDRDAGAPREWQLAQALDACWGAPIFDRNSECRACVAAVIEGVY